MISTYRTSLDLGAPTATAYEVLTDYGELRHWVPGVEHSRVLAREGDIAVVELSAEDFRLVLEVVHSPPDAAAFSQVDRYHRQGVSGEWRLVEGSAGATLEIRLRSDTGIFEGAARKRLRGIVEATVAAARGRITDQMTGVIATRRKILEVVRRPESIEVWFRGESYELARKEDE